MNVYLLEVNVYEDEYEKDWLTGMTAVYTTAEGALERFKLWCLDNYIDPAEAMLGMTNDERTPGQEPRSFTGNDVEVSMEDETVYLSWGINQMEVQG